MNMSYTRQLMYTIADELGRNRREMDVFVNVLQKNWYDSKQSLQTLTVNDYDRFEIPRRLSSMIIERVGGRAPMSSNTHSSMQQQASVYRTAESLKQKVSKDKFAVYVDTLLRIMRNIRGNITQQKFRILKKSNEKISDLLAVPQICSILTHAGFQSTQDAIVLRNVNIGKLDDILESLSKFDQSTKFDPYRAQITNISGNQSQIQGESSVVFNQKLEELEKQRQMIMSTPIRDRDIKIYRMEGKEIKPDASWNDDRELNETEKQYAESIKDRLKSYSEDPKFMNRRKQQYYDLLKKPCYSETLVRVKCPDNWVFQCKFSPLETLSELVKVFDEYIQNKNLPYYLYMTPPVERLHGMNLRQTFYDKGCVPRAIFYFGSDLNINGNVLRQKKTGLFGLFS